MIETLRNTIEQSQVLTWIAAVVVAILTFALLSVIKALFQQRLSRLVEKTHNDVDDLLVTLLSETKGVVILIASVYAGTLILNLPREIDQIVGLVAVATGLIQLALWGNQTLTYVLEKYVRSRISENASEATVLSTLGFIGRLFLWGLVLVLIIDNIPGMEASSLVAGLGITGIAVALAVQNILGDLLASLSIVFDKPFVIGDFIIVDDLMGTVSAIGMKTTRVRSLSGEELIFSNNDLLQSRIRNYKRMWERRVVFEFGVVYNTPFEKLSEIPNMVQQVVEATAQTRFDRAHFKSFGDFALVFEVVYFVTDADYNLYMDIQQQINLAIYKSFAGEGIEFAFPTQTLYVASTTTNA